MTPKLRQELEALAVHHERIAASIRTTLTALTNGAGNGAMTRRATSEMVPRGARTKPSLQTAILAVLSDSAQPLQPDELWPLVQGHGFETTMAKPRNALSAILGSLKARGRVKHTADGWALR